MPKTINVETKPCPLCKKVSHVRLWEDSVIKWQGGELIQNVWPNMSAEDRELLITGTHSICWNEMFSEAAAEAFDFIVFLQGDEPE